MKYLPITSTEGVGAQGAVNHLQYTDDISSVAASIRANNTSYQLENIYVKLDSDIDEERHVGHFLYVVGKHCPLLRVI